MKTQEDDHLSQEEISEKDEFLMTLRREQPADNLIFDLQPSEL